MGSRRPKRYDKRDFKDDHSDRRSLPQAATSVIDGETHDRIVENLKSELATWQERTNQAEGAIDKVRSDAIVTVSDYKSRFDQMQVELKAALSSAEEAKKQIEAMKKDFAKREADLLKSHGKLVKELRRKIDGLEEHEKLMRNELEIAWSKARPFGPVTESTDANQRQHVEGEEDHALPGGGAEEPKRLSECARQADPEGAGGHQQV